MICPTRLDPRHRIAVTAGELAAMVAALRAHPSRAVDFETDGLRWAKGDRPVGYSVGYLEADGTHRAWYVPFAHRTADVQAAPSAAWAALDAALEGAAELVGQNLKFDMHMAMAGGHPLPADAAIHDTMVQGHLVYEERSMALEDLAASAGVSPWDPHESKGTVDAVLRDAAKARRMTLKKDDYETGRASYLTTYGHSEVPVGVEAEYSCRDVAHALLLDRAQRAEAMGLGEPWEARRRALYANEMLLVRALQDVEWTGQLVDVPYLFQLADDLDLDLERRGAALDAAFGVRLDWSNDNAVRDFLYNGLGARKGRFTDSGQPSVDRAALLDMAGLHPAIPDIAEYGIRLRVRTTYTKGIAWFVGDDGRVHTTIRQTGTRTGRFSEGDPTLHNIPVRHPEMGPAVRRAFYIPAGTTRVLCDYSQVELRVLAYTTGGRVLTDAYHSDAYDALLAGWTDYDGYRAARAAEPEADIHRDVAVAMWPVECGIAAGLKRRRSCAKPINFGVPYGMGPDGLQSNPDLRLSEQEAREYLDLYARTNPEVDETKRKLVDAMRRRDRRDGRGPFFVNWTGRKRHVAGVDWPPRGRASGALREAFASLIQGGAGEMTRYAMVRLWQARCDGTLRGRPCGTVHDEIHVDCDDDDLRHCASETQRHMEEPFVGCFGSVPIVAKPSFTRTTWAAKEDLK